MWHTGLRWVILSGIAAGALFSENIPDLNRPDPLAGRVRPVKKEKEMAPPVRLPDSNDAIRWALEDLQTLGEEDRFFTRYLFVPDGEKKSMRSSSLTLNYISRGSGIRRPVPVSDGRLLRLDIRWYAPREKDLRDWLATWEELAFDPAFALLLTRDTLAFSGIDRRVLPTRKVKRTVVTGKRRGLVSRNPPRWGLVDKTTEIEETLPVFGKEGEDVTRFDSRGIDPVRFRQLQIETRSAAPVVEHRYFKSRALTSIKDAKVFKTVFGGLYYEFKGVKKAKDVLGQNTKATDLDLFLENVGIGNIKGGLNADDLFDKLRSDQGIVMFRSQVTAKPRDIWTFNTPAGREGTGWGAITGDVKDGNIDIGDRAFANLLTPRRDAREAIFPDRAGLLIFALFNEAGARQDEVPQEIANDSTIPNPFPQRLQILGCITCHSMKGKDGWQPMENQIKKLIAGRLDIFGDDGLKDRLSSDKIDRLAGRYTGSFDKNLRRARDDVAEATLVATGPWEGSEDQADVCKLAAERIHSEYGSYWWTAVDASVALRELGLRVDPRDALSMFEQVFPPDLRNVGDGFIPEDPRIAALAAGLSINRSDFALARDFLAERARRSPIWVKLRGTR